MKKLTKLLSVFIIAGAMGTGAAFAAGCSHKHTFSGEWTVENGQHWHAATCKHTDEKAEFGDCVDVLVNDSGEAGSDNLCDVCGSSTGIELNETGISIKKNEEFTLELTLYSENATGYTVEWESDKPEIATVSGNGVSGVVKGISKGIATITVKAGGKTATCTVNVTDDGTVTPPAPETKYSITYEINGHGTAPANVAEATALPAELPVLTAEGWTFGGWFTDSGLNTAAVAGATLTANATLYAKWTQNEQPGPGPENPTTKYSITYVINGHGIQPTNETEATALPATLPVLTAEGWTFGGWYTDNETFANAAVPGAALTANATLYAKWTEKQSEQPAPDTKFSVTYVINGHGKQPEQETKVTALPAQLPVLKANGWVFGGWYTDNDTFANAAVPGAALTANATLYAKWTKKASTVVGVQLSEEDFKAAIQATLDVAQFTCSTESESVKADEMSNAFIVAGGRYVVYEAQAKQLVKYSSVSDFAWEKQVIHTNVADFTAAKKLLTGDMIDTLQAFLDADYSTVVYNKDTDRYSIGDSYLTFDDGKVYTFASSDGAEKTLSGYGAEIELPDFTLTFENILVARTANNEVGKLTVRNNSSSYGLYASDDASDNCVEMTANGYQQKTKQGGAGLETCIVLGLEGNIEGYFELTASKYGSSWDIIQFISGGAKKFCVNILSDKGNAKYNLGTGNSGSQTSPLTETTFTAKTKIRYSLTKPAAGGNYKLTLTVNGEPFVTNLDIGTDTVDRITLPASNIKNGPRNLTIDKVIVCGTPKAGAAKPVQSIELNKYETRIEQIGGKETLVATVTPADATEKTIKWTSSNTSVATVDSNGVVTAVADGTAVITATSSNGRAVSCTVNVGEKSLPMYNVSFVSDDKTVGSQTVEKGDCAVEPDELRKPGYIFKGWYLEEEGENEYDFTAPVQGSLTLYAVWDINEALVDPEPEIPVASNIKIKRAAGDQESAYLEWTSETNDATWFNVYYKIEGGSFVKLDGELVRQYEDGHYRADAVGLKGGKYSMKIVPCAGDNENDSASLTVSNLVVRAHERTGFAFVNGTSSGAYNEDGTLQSNARVIYVTEKNKDSVSLEVLVGKNNETRVGVQDIVAGFKKGTETRPLAIRFIGNISDPANMPKGDLYVDGVKAGVTFEGIGDDATANGWGIVIKGSSNIEVRNLGFMNCDSEEGDNVGLQQDNDHVWVHNCDMFYGGPGGDSDQAKGDGALDTKKSTYVTHSFNHFWDSGKCNLQGMKDETTSNYITYHHNWYDHSDSRHPRIRTCTVHIYNNYFDGNAKYGVGVTKGASAFVENNYFRSEAAMRPMMSSGQGTDAQGDGTFSGEDGGMIKSFGNVYDCLPTNLKLLTQKDTSADNIDCYEASTRNEQVPSSYKTKAGSTTYNNFDTASDFYSYDVQTPEDAQFTVTKYAGRVGGGDLKYEFDNATEDANYSVIPALKAKLTSYKSTLAKVNNESVK